MSLITVGSYGSGPNNYNNNNEEKKKILEEDFARYLYLVLNCRCVYSKRVRHRQLINTVIFVLPVVLMEFRPLFCGLSSI